ncbi:uncharacterized protein C7orf26-like [Limulus polyphemus]|uniref:Uncharacterized protein C7orf26-like n=1 Tax=Limulus polyphemus TaxID=6850 RepID=A0ABM1B6Z5_LIMPO|nr:uncharacterized protein C7orf26-like [Limulus polyphemus]
MTDVSLQLKNYLRKLDMPAVLSETLCQIEEITFSSDASRSYQQLITELVEEFVFSEIDRRGQPKRKLSEIRELQILHSLCDYFSESRKERRLAIFLLLFPCSSRLPEKRQSLLAQLVSLAVAVKNSSILQCVGMWMQYIGCTSTVSMYVANTLLTDYFKVIPDCTGYLVDLPEISPVFCASLIVALTRIVPETSPPLKVVELISQWIGSSSSVCFSPLEILPPDPSHYTEPESPLCGLLLWCILSPFRECKSDVSPYDKVILSSHDSLKPIEKSDNSSNVFSCLHLMLLETMMKSGQSRYDVTLLKYMVPIHEVIRMIKIVSSKCTCVNPSSDAVEVSMSRLAQMLQIACASKCLQGNLEDIFKLVHHLPYSRLLHIVTGFGRK